MKKAELISEVAKESGETNATVTRVLAALQSSVIGAVAAGDEVKLTGFVAFSPVVQAARVATNPRTGEKIDVAEKKAVRVRPLSVFKDTVANG